MILINQSKTITDEEILNMFKNLENHFKLVKFDESTHKFLQVLNQEGTFYDNPETIYVTDAKNPYGYLGLAYNFGAVSIYDIENTIKSYKNLGKYIVKLRILHEILHHFNKPADDLEKWGENHPFIMKLYVLGHKSGETLLGVIAQTIYYKTLLQGIDEKSFNLENNIANRTYFGSIKE